MATCNWVIGTRWGKTNEKQGSPEGVALVNELKNKKKEVKEEYVHHMNRTGHLQRLISTDFCVYICTYGRNCVVVQIWH